MVTVDICTFSIFYYYRVQFTISISQRVKLSLRSTIVLCPCGCETDLDENHAAGHDGDAGSAAGVPFLVGGKCEDGIVVRVVDGGKNKSKKAVDAVDEEEDDDEGVAFQ